MSQNSQYPSQYDGAPGLRQSINSQANQQMLDSQQSIVPGATAHVSRQSQHKTRVSIGGQLNKGTGKQYAKMPQQDHYYR